MSESEISQFIEPLVGVGFVVEGCAESVEEKWS